MLGLEEGSFPRRTHGSPFLDDDERRAIDGAEAPRLAKPDPVVARPLSLLHGVHAAVAAPVPRARGGDRRRRAARAEPVLGRGAGALRPGRRRALRRRRRPLSALDWPLDARADRARAAARARAARGRATPTRPPRSRARTAGSGGSTRALGRLRAADAPDRPGACSTRCARRRRFSRHGARALRRLLVDLVRRAGARPAARSTPRSTRGSAARSRTRRCSSSSPGCRSGSASSASPPDRLDEALAFLRECLAEAIAGGVWIELGDLQRRELEEGLWRDLEQFVRAEAESELAARPAPLRGLVRLRALGARAPARPRPGRLPALREDRPDRPRSRSARAGSSRTTSRARPRTRRRRSRASSGSRSRSTCSCCATSSASSRSAASTARSPASGRRAGCSRPRREEDVPGLLARATTSTRRSSGRRSSARRSTPVRFVERIREGDVQPRPARRLPCPTWCELASDVPGGEVVTVVEDTRAPNAEQLAAIEAPGSSSSPPARGRARRPCSSSASRAPLRARARRRLGPRRSPTPSARPPSCAARIRARLAELGRHELARELDGAWISTIHGFCHRLLKRAPVRGRARPALPRARREPGARARRARRSTRRSTSSAPAGDAERLRLLATYGARGLRRMLTGVYETLRVGRARPRARALGAARPRGAASRSSARPRAASSRTGRAGQGGRAASERRAGPRAARARPPAAERLLDLSEIAARGGPRSGSRATRRRGTPSSRRRSTSSPRATALCSRSCCGASSAAYAAAKDARVGARLRGPAAARARPPSRRRRDPRARELALPLRSRRRVPGHEPAPVRADRPARDARSSSSSATSSSRSTASATPTSRSSASAARRSGGVLALTQNCRSRPEVLAGRQPPVRGATSATTFQPLAAAGRFPDPAFGPAVELLVTDKASYKDARHALARRRGEGSRARG